MSSAAAADGRPQRSSVLGAYAAVVALAVACYARTLDVPWYFDDLPGIVNHPLTRDLPAALRSVLAPRGLGYLTFALDFSRAGLSVRAFHATNLAIHVAAGCAALALLRRAFPRRLDLALLAALVFVAHPLQTQAVTYVVQRLTSLAGALSLGSVLLYVVAREALERGARVRTAAFLAPYLGAAVLAGAAMLVKQNAVVLPALLALAELLLPGLASSPAPAWRRLAWVAPIAAVTAVLALGPIGGGGAISGAAGINPGSFDADAVGGLGASRLEYFSTELEVLWRYLRLLVWPVGQMFDAGMEISRDPFRPAALVAGAGLATLVAVAVAFRRRAPIVAFGVLWFFAALSVESTFIVLDPYFEHRLYLPMLGAAAALAALLERVSDRRRVAAAGVAAVCVLAALTIARNEQWRDPAKLWAADLAHGSSSYRSAFGLADGYHRSGEERRALEVYAQLIVRGEARCRERGCGARYLQNLGVAAERSGDLQAAGAFYEQAIASNPSFANAHLGLGVVAYRQGRKAEARARFEEAVRLAPADTNALVNLCSVALELGDPEPARRNLARIRAADPAQAAQLEAELAASEAAGR